MAKRELSPDESRVLKFQGATILRNEGWSVKMIAIAIDMTERNVRRILDGDGKRIVYFIQVENDGPIKIGVTSSDVRSRLSALQTGIPFNLNLIGMVEDESGDLEARLHEMFSEHHIRGEWFRPAPALMAFIAEPSAKADP